MTENPTYQELEKRIHHLERSELRCKKNKKALQENLNRYRTIVAHLPLLVCNFFPGGEISYVNDAYCDYFEKASDELVRVKFPVADSRNRPENSDG
jgi:PAS domain-containing protein